MPDLRRARQGRRPSRSMWRACQRSSCAPAPTPISPGWCSIGRRLFPMRFSRRRPHHGALPDSGAVRSVGSRPFRAALGEERRLAFGRRCHCGRVRDRLAIPAFTISRMAAKVVLDILAPKTDATAYAPPGMLKPQVTAMKNGLSPKQAQAITDTANQLAGKSAPPVAQPAKPDVKAETKTADAKPANAKTADTKPAESKPAPAPVAQTPANAQTADSHLIKNGAVVAFKGAGTHAECDLRARPDRLDRAGQHARHRCRRGSRASWAISPPRWKRRPLRAFRSCASA